MTASKRGTAMVEAALVIPFIILAVVTITTICMTMYGYIEDNVSLHAGILKESGKESETFSISPGPSDMPSVERGGRKISGIKTSGTFTGGLMPRGKAVSRSDAKVIREKEYIRKWDNVLPE